MSLSLQRNSKAPWKLGGMKSKKIKDKEKKKVELTGLSHFWIISDYVTEHCK